MDHSRTGSGTRFGLFQTKYGRGGVLFLRHGPASASPDDALDLRGGGEEVEGGIDVHLLQARRSSKRFQSR